MHTVYIFYIFGSVAQELIHLMVCYSRQVNLELSNLGCKLCINQSLGLYERDAVRKGLQQVAPGIVGYGVQLSARVRNQLPQDFVLQAAKTKRIRAEVS
jgi:hypothetical protein